MAAPQTDWDELPGKSRVYKSGYSGIIAECRHMDELKGEITILLERMSTGDRSAENVLMPRVYVELRRLAMLRLLSERRGHTLQPTDLVHEAYVKLCRQNSINWQGRAHFFRIAARQMHRILIDYGRKRNAIKRGDGRVAVELESGSLLVSENHLATAMELDDLLEKLAAMSPRQAQIVEMRFFAGLDEIEMAAALGITPRTVRRDWLKARAWLHEQLKGS